MKIPVLFGVAVVAGCHPAAGLAPAPGSCRAGVPATAENPIATRAAALAGDYELIQVRTQPIAGVVSSGRLHLSKLDSAARAAAVGGPVRDLIGWMVPASGDSGWRAIVSSHDPARPGAVLAGRHLRLGQAGLLDGYVEHLTITAVAEEGFWGWWRAEPGLKVRMDSESGRALPDPAGYFCALRVRP